MGLADPHKRALDWVGRQWRPGKPVQQPDELGQRERPRDPSMGLDDGSHHVLALEAEHEVERLQLDPGKVARGVARKIEAELLRNRDRLGQRRLAPEIQGAERDDPQGQALRLACQQRCRERAAEAVARADERDAKQLAQRTLSGPIPSRRSSRSCLARTSRPATRGAVRIARAFQTRGRSLGQSAAASR